MYHHPCIICFVRERRGVAIEYGLAAISLLYRTLASEGRGKPVIGDISKQLPPQQLASSLHPILL